MHVKDIKNIQLIQLACNLCLCAKTLNYNRKGKIE